MPSLRRICVYCGSRLGSRPIYAEAARATGRVLAARGTEVVYGGGDIGLMGELADATLAAGGHVIGVITRSLLEWEVGHGGVSELRVVETMHERKALMADLSDGFLALPGGFGTLDELLETLTWAQLGIHTRPCGLWNVEGFFDPLLGMLDHAVSEGFLSAAHRRLVLQGTELEPLLADLEGYTASPVDRKVERRIR